MLTHRKSEPIAIANFNEAQKAANTTRSKVRARVEHVFGDSAITTSGSLFSSRPS
jgi:hypothetical protein